jgi:hypothetical protein
MPHGGPIWIADVLRAFRDLRPDDAAAGTILRCLGVDRAPVIRPARVSGAFEHSAMRPRPSGGVPAAASARPEPDTSGGPSHFPGAAAGPTSVAQLRKSGDPDRPPPWFTATLPLERPTGRPVPVNVPPLFLAVHARGILSAGLATREPDGPIDMAEVIARLARREVIAVLPRLAQPSLRHGVQVLEDHAPAMAPFVEDCRQLIGEMLRTVGRFRVSLLRFRGIPPTRKQEPIAAGRPRWSPPPRGTPIAVLSDLGIGGAAADPARALPADWVAFAAEASEAGCPVVAFVPFGPRRWHPLVARAMTIIHWDRRTSAGAVRRAVGPGHGIPT